MTEFSYQLYSSRNFGPLAETLNTLASLGYSGVEGYGGLFSDAGQVDALKAALTDTGLKMTSSHIGLDMIEGDADGVLKLCETLGIQEVYVPFVAPDDRPTDAAGWTAFGTRLAEACAPLSGAGLTCGWHNHDFEFQPLADGQLPIDLLLDADASLAFEFDVAWAIVAGHDPQTTIDRHGGRITAAHVKDRAPEGKTTEDGWSDVGDGIIDWGTLLTSLRAAGCKNFVMEHDNPSDDTRFARASLAHAKSL